MGKADKLAVSRAIDITLRNEVIDGYVGGVKCSAGFERRAIDDRLEQIKAALDPSIDAKAMERFWNFEKKIIRSLFEYNPVERHPKLKSPDEIRIDATKFSAVLASVMRAEDEITLMGRGLGDESPLADNLGAFIPRGRLIISGETGDGTVHHLGPDARVVLQGPTGDNLGFGSSEDATICAATAIGKNPAPNVSGPIASLPNLHR